MRKIMLGERPYINPYEEGGQWLPTPYGRAVAPSYELTDENERNGTAAERKVR